MTDPMQVEAEIRSVIADHVSVPDDPRAPLQLPSLSLVMVAEELEARFGFVVLAREMVPENFGSVAGLVAFVERRLAS
jgi:acyl carrier protein